MNKEDVHMWDWSRILAGEVPAEFFIELLLRTAVIYLILILTMRLLGRRMAAQLGRNELAAMVSLAAAIGVPLHSPDRGILPAVVIALVILLISRGTALLLQRYPKFEQFSQGNYATLVADGVLNAEAMKDVRISRERLFAQLRKNNIRHLGEVSRLYMEAGGGFTLIRAEKPRPGLMVVPDWDKDYCARQKARGDKLVCNNCGTSKAESGICPTCCKDVWIAGVE